MSELDRSKCPPEYKVSSSSDCAGLSADLVGNLIVGKNAEAQAIKACWDHRDRIVEDTKARMIKELRRERDAARQEVYDIISMLEEIVETESSGNSFAKTILERIRAGLHHGASVRLLHLSLKKVKDAELQLESVRQTLSSLLNEDT